MQSQKDKEKDSKKLTAGAIRRAETERQRKEQRELQEKQRLEKKQRESIISEISGKFKKTIVAGFLEEFSHNYGEEINYKTFSDCFEFTTQIGKNEAILPSFNFNADKIEFRSDVRNRIGRFNLNTYDNFISNQDEIKGNILSPQQFQNMQEKISYEDKKYEFEIDQEINQPRGNFSPTSTDNRYGNFNRINKLRGFSTIQSTEQQAREKTKNLWDNQKDKIIKESTKK